MTKPNLNSKKPLVLLVGALAFALLLAACSSGTSTAASSDQSSGTESSASPSASADSAQSDEADGTMTLGEYLSDWYTSYDMFDEGVKSGDNVPKSLRLIVSGKTDGYIHDEKTIVEYWNELSSIRIDASSPVGNEHSGEYIGFDFDSYRELIPFDFYSTGYAKARDGKVVRVLDSDKVEELVNSLTELVKAEQGDGLGELPNENGAYLWDADGDGNPEHISVSIIGNGDEAPNVGVVELRSIISDIDTEIDINGVYDFESFESCKDDKGPYLVIEYLAGDYYSHERLARCTLRLVGKDLVVEETD